MKSDVLAFSHSLLCRKIGQDQPKVIICAIMVVLGYPMLHTKFQGHWSTGSGEEDFFKGFYHIWAWWPYWSCDLEGLYNFLFPQPKEALKEIWLHLAQWGIDVLTFKDFSFSLAWAAILFMGAERF